MHGPIINFILSNPNDICIPLGIFIRYFGTFLDFVLHRKNNTSKNEDLMTKTYAHMVELHERSDEAAEERANSLVKHALLKKENKDLKVIITGLVSQIDEMKKHIEDLEARLKK